MSVRELCGSNPTKYVMVGGKTLQSYRKERRSEIHATSCILNRKKAKSYLRNNEAKFDTQHSYVDLESCVRGARSLCTVMQYFLFPFKVLKT